MNLHPILRLGSVKDVAVFEEYVKSRALAIPCDRDLISRENSPLRSPLIRGEIRIGNRIAVQPMEGWDDTPDGQPTENTIRRWRRFGQSGAKLIWGGEAVAVSHEGRANPNQLLIAPHTHAGLARLRAALIEEHRRTTGSDAGLLIGLQLTHSGASAARMLTIEWSPASSITIRFSIAGWAYLLTILCSLMLKFAPS
jgi:NADPH2 dehydrogenase